MLPIVLPAPEVACLAEEAAGLAELCVDLEQQTISAASGRTIPFDVDASRRHALLLGLDEIGETMQHAADIGAWQAAERANRPCVSTCNNSLRSQPCRGYRGSKNEWRIGMGRSSDLRRLLAGTDIVVAPGVFDGITARFSEQAGFPCAYMTGAGTSLSLGYPDLGLLTMTEMADKARVITRTVAVPVIADADTGYGSEVNTTRTVQEYIRAGLAGLHIEDQVSPKRCGHLDGKELVSREEFVAKVRAAVAARMDPDFLIIARTDARGVVGLDEAVQRANAALDAGADMAFVEAIPTLQELAEVPRRVRGPCLLNVVRAGKTPDVNLLDAQAMGYRLAIMPSLLLGAAMEAYDAALAIVKETHQPPASAGKMRVADRFRRFGSDEWDALRTRFRDPETAPAGKAA